MTRKLECKKCGKRWLPHVENPLKCPNPKCQSYDWAKAVKAQPDDRTLNVDTAKNLIP